MFCQYLTNCFFLSIYIHHIPPKNFLFYEFWDL
nr:MAG TPA: hypothetical protein [Crassvirales sp.]